MDKDLGDREVAKGLVERVTKAMEDSIMAEITNLEVKEIVVMELEVEEIVEMELEVKEEIVEMEEDSTTSSTKVLKVAGEVDLEVIEVDLEVIGELDLEDIGKEDSGVTGEVSEEKETTLEDLAEIEVDLETMDSEEEEDLKANPTLTLEFQSIFSLNPIMSIVGI